ncbi:leucine-rich repeat protein, partial [Candidatus Saccharibacteria bacterium]|nr:leucine-rich repeat protein [Candidatus Saccharibacteria bacterium]
MGKKFFLKGLFIAVLSFIVATIFGSSASYAEAVITRGLFTDENDVRWEWQKTIDAEKTEEPEMVSIMFYDKPAAATTVVVPSLSDVIAAASATSTLDTYYVHSADQESQDAYFTSETRRDFGSHVTKLDMTNTSKVQVMGIKPILNAETEAELVFGENMVIGDGEGSLEPIITPVVKVGTCVEYEESGAEDYYGTKYYKCVNFEEKEYVVFTSGISKQIYNSSTGYWETKSWDDFSSFEKKSFKPDTYTIGCSDYKYAYQSYYDGISESDLDRCMVDWSTAKIETRQEASTGVFAGYKLKLTNLENVKYLGWYAFQHATFDESSRAITVNANQTAGEGVFAHTNVNSVSILGTQVFPRMFAGCNDLSAENIDFGTAETVSYGAFEDTNLGTLDLSGTNVKLIYSFAFKNANLSSINIDGVEILDYEAFANNNLTELYLPKSLKNMNTGGIFAGNNNLTKLTVAYDMMQVGMLTPLHYAIGEYVGEKEDAVATRITDLTVIAPYGADEEVDRERSSYATFVGYRQLSGYYVDFGADSNDYGRADTYKNVIAPAGFAWFTGLENITIGEGYEFIGANAFYSYLYGKYRFGPVGYHMNNVLDYVTYSNLLDDRFHVSLPEGLKGIGGNAFASHPLGDFEINLPESLEYIGGHAFVNDLFMDNDIDLPNLRYIGFQAFFVSGVHNVYLHDKLEYVGYVPFMGCWNLNDVTFDFDVFSTSMFGFGTGTWGAAMFEHPIVTWSSYGDELSRGLYGEERIVQTAVGWDQYTIKRGNIVFTEKAVTAPYGSPYWFYMTAAKTVDMSKTPWTEIPVGAFLGSSIDTLLLPEHTETIAPTAFVNARIRDELVL